MTLETTCDFEPESFEFYNCCVCNEAINIMSSDIMVVSYVYNTYAHIWCYWDDRLKTFEPSKNLQEILGDISDTAIDAGLIEVLMNSIQTEVLEDKQKAIVDGYNKGIINHFKKMRMLKGKHGQT